MAIPSRIPTPMKGRLSIGHASSFFASKGGHDSYVEQQLSYRNDKFVSHLRDDQENVPVKKVNKNKRGRRPVKKANYQKENSNSRGSSTTVSRSSSNNDQNENSAHFVSRNSSNNSTAPQKKKPRKAGNGKSERRRQQKDSQTRALKSILNSQQAALGNTNDDIPDVQLTAVSTEQEDEDLLADFNEPCTVVHSPGEVKLCTPGDTALHVAVLTSDTGSVKRLVRVGSLNRSDINAPNAEGETPLHLAAKQGNAELVEHLVAECRADVAAKNRSKHRETPLAVAVREGKAEAVSRLLHMGASVAEWRSRSNGDNLLHLAVGEGKSRATLHAMMLLAPEVCGLVNQSNRSGKTPFDCLIQDLCRDDLTEQERDNLLMLVNELLAGGCRIEQDDSEIFNHIAEGGNIALAELLASYGLATEKLSKLSVTCMDIWQCQQDLNKAITAGDDRAVQTLLESTYGHLTRRTRSAIVNAYSRIFASDGEAGTRSRPLQAAVRAHATKDVLETLFLWGCDPRLCIFPVDENDVLDQMLQIVERESWKCSPWAAWRDVLADQSGGDFAYCPMIWSRPPLRDEEDPEAYDTLCQYLESCNVISLFVKAIDEADGDLVIARDVYFNMISPVQRHHIESRVALDVQLADARLGMEAYDQQLEEQQTIIDEQEKKMASLQSEIFDLTEKVEQLIVSAKLDQPDLHESEMETEIIKTGIETNLRTIVEDKPEADPALINEKENDAKPIQGEEQVIGGQQRTATEKMRMSREIPDHGKKPKQKACCIVM
eukprot:Clim_evm10s172 gene=Clim_evmTU10s172